MLVRQETAEDVAAVRGVVAEAFAGPDGTVPVEVGLLDRLREDSGWLPTYSLVALAGGGEATGAVVGHVVCSRGWVRDHPALGLGPLAVRPAAQGRGVGSALVHAVLGAAEACGETLVALLGEPAFYRRFGFGPGAAQGLAAPDPSWGVHFQSRAFGPAPAGEFVYAAPFAEL